ncbi:DUF11 domain-containing protein [uncultured Methanobrevibacter sp.]|uniref:DUF11 domain-containing protein n=1 Tax=uncultured Methanobrevibacter sp. TaxID=253161 RepID=UPI002631D5E2|nr:DUF11 domain-containing protein [uncultured Methanobrevibacter sp.]
MNFNSRILKISIVIALIFMLIPIVAAEDSTDSVYAEDAGIDEINAIEAQDDMEDTVLLQEESDDIVGDSDDDLLDDEEEPTEGDYDSELEPFVSVPVEDDDESSADLQIRSFVVPSKLKVGDYAIFTFIVTNNGPDMAENVVAYANVVRGDVLYISSSCNKGEYNSYTGVWDIGDLDAGDYAMLLVLGRVLTDEPITTLAYVNADTFDPDYSNNSFRETLYVESENSGAAEVQKMPATGNPVVMAILAVLAIVGVTVGRRN